MNQLFRTISVPIFISFIFFDLSFGQVEEAIQDSVRLDSSVVSKENISPLASAQYYHFNKLINTNFDGFADVMRNNEKIQIFDFMEPGQPRFIAPLNMFPHQAANFVDGIERNEYTNGMFNTRFISLDHTESLTRLYPDGYYKGRSIRPQSVNAHLRRVEEEDAYTRLKFYEGDFNYTDLDILFARKYTDNLRIGLAGFNKGYNGTSDGSGFVLNNAHTGVSYNAFAIYQINKSTQSEFTFRLNHERSGVHKRGQASNFTYSGNGSTYRLRFIFDVDTLSDNKVVLGFIANNSRHKNRSRADSFEVKQRSDDYKVFLSKDFSTARNKLTVTFNLDNHRIWGNAFDNSFSDTRFSLNLSNKFALNKKAWLNAGLDVEQLNDFDPNFNVSLSSGYYYTNFFSGLNVLYSDRYPNPVERAFLFGSYKGNANLKSETFIDFSFTQRWRPADNLFFESRLGTSVIKNEVLFNGSSFYNRTDRTWNYVTGQAGFDFWKLKLSGGGHLLAANKAVSARQMLWGRLAYHDYWFNTILIDATANMNWYSRHDAVFYNPLLNRFYSGSGENASYMVFNFKIVGTVSDAEIFIEMDNLFKTKVQFIEGYFNELGKVRFGVNWILWD